MKYFLNLILFAFVLVGCDTESANRSTVNSLIEGNYVLTSLVSNVAVDFNQDGISNVELLAEASCFTAMDINFMLNGDFVATVAEPDFDVNNVLSCPTSSQSGTYSIDANSVLTVMANVNGGTITENKQVLFTSTTFEFTITGVELDSYISDRMATPAGSISSLRVVYTKI